MKIIIYRRIIRYCLIFCLSIALTPLFYLLVRFGLPMWGVAVGMLAFGVFGELFLYRKMERFYLNTWGRWFKNWRELERAAHAKNKEMRKAVDRSTV